VNPEDAQHLVTFVLDNHHMRDRMDKRDRAAMLRTRLAEAMAERGITQSALARLTGVDRSTISALLSHGTRLPNAQLAADCAGALGISADWLLGLSGRPEPIADLLAT
jgi:transcriptional regulator with XRE-family HTH domain